MTRHPQAWPGTPTSLADYLHKQRIHPCVQAASTDELLRTLARSLHAAGTISVPHTLARAARTRLTQGSKGFHGIALLPTRSRTVNTPAAAFARIPPALAWQGDDRHPIHDVFLLVAPRTPKNTGYVQAYSTLARHTAHAGFRRMLAAARTTDELYELFRLIR
ncbi:PTS sugar transporter subunit IIA [Streptomyces rimosus]|uniref:PTS sugar transporter subunit IIA n=1 Tax=Streptomyces rimosus TaxID=1927 RepID=UPI0031DA0AC5